MYVHISMAKVYVYIIICSVGTVSRIGVQRYMNILIHMTSSYTRIKAYILVHICIYTQYIYAYIYIYYNALIAYLRVVPQTVGQQKRLPAGAAVRVEHGEYFMYRTV